MANLRLLENVASPERHQGEVFACDFLPDGSHVLTGGWDGTLRMWDASSGRNVLTIQAGPKPLSACACSPDGRNWVCGNMEGLYTSWDAVAQQQTASFVAHTRPISAIDFSPDGQTVATSSWDRQVSLRKLGKEREGRTLGQHYDIVAGCAFTPDGNTVVSWSYDGTVKIWDVAQGREVATLNGHTDRVTALCLSPDGRYALSGGRDSTIRLWDLEQYTEIAVVNLGAEVRACFYLLDAESVVVADAVGRLFLMALPTFQVHDQLQTPFRVQCGDLSPSGTTLALGAEEGEVHYVAIDGFESAPLVVTALTTIVEQATMMDRFFGTKRRTRVYSYTCPSCRHNVETATIPAGTSACPRCRRRLRVNVKAPAMQKL